MGAPPQAPTLRRLPVVLAAIGTLALALAAALPYVDTLDHTFVWDDHLIRTQIGRALEDGGLPKVLAAPYMPSPGVPNDYFRPVVYFTYWLDRRIGGDTAFAAHATNVLLHVSATMAVGALLLLLLGDEIAALAGGLVFAVHPVHVESAAWVSGRTDLLCALFVTVSVVAWLQGTRETGRARRWCLAASGISFGLALFSKEAAVALPAAAWICHATLESPTNHESRWRDVRAAALTFGVPLALVLIVRHAVLHDELGYVGPIAQVRGSLLVQEPATAVRALVRVLRALVVPWPHNALMTRADVSLELVSIVAVAALVAGCLWFGRRCYRRAGLVAALWIAVFAAPSLLVPAAGAVVAAERYMYVPSIGVAMLAGAAWARWGPLGGLAAVPRLAVACAITLTVGSIAGSRASVWASEDALTRDVVRTSDGSPLAHQLRGDELVRQGRAVEAVPEYERASSLNPLDAVVWHSLGRAHLRANHPADAVTAFRRAVAAEPDWAAARVDLALTCARVHDWRCVESERAALRNSPDDLRALRRLLP